MARVWIAADKAAAGTVPAVCARSGEPCITRYQRRFFDVPEWAEWLLWTDAWPVPRMGAVRQATVVLPLLPGARARARWCKRVRDWSVVAALALVSLAVLADTAQLQAIAAWLRATGLAAVAVHLVVAALGLWLTVGTRLDPTGEWIEFRRVHPAFVAAAEALTPRPAVDPGTARQARSAAIRDPGVRGEPAAGDRT